MTVTLEIPPEVEAGLLAQAQASGLSLQAYAEHILREHSGIGPDVSRAQLAGQRIRELRKGITLGGIPIKLLIEEGRE